jgi:hypothetical protein
MAEAWDAATEEERRDGGPFLHKGVAWRGLVDPSTLTVQGNLKYCLEANVGVGDFNVREAQVRREERRAKRSDELTRTRALGNTTCNGDERNEVLLAAMLHIRKLRRRRLISRTCALSARTDKDARTWKYDVQQRAWYFLLTPRRCTQQNMTRVHARTVNLPPFKTFCKPSLSEVNSSDIDRLVQVGGTVTRVAEVKMMEVREWCGARSEATVLCMKLFRSSPLLLVAK